jgi:HEAT repeat protein
MHLTQRILDYENYLSESDYLDELAGSVAVNDLFDAIVELLQAKDPEVLTWTLSFVKDLILWSPGKERDAARKQYPKSVVIKAIEPLLWSENHRIRQLAGYVLGTTRSYSSLPAMVEAFYHWRDRDPLML